MVLVAIPVHERAELVRHCFATAAELILPQGSRIVVHDDASPTLDVARLIADTGLTAQLERAATRRGASGTITHIWRSFLGSDQQYLLFLDSDMIINRDALGAGLDRMAGFDGLLTLYNSIIHPGEPLGPDLVKKGRIGNAGTLWRRPLVEAALAAVGGQAYIDDRYCEFFGARNIPLAAMARSRVQHLGIAGENYHPFGALDHGIGFVPDSPRQSAAIVHAHDQLLSRQDALLPSVSWLRARRGRSFWRRLIGR
ncbi:glycosyltransferase family 2 protein [Mesorhizobium comanense]|uniref:glycosyltransferase family 2 protein n=1 Tax=Mesorhizobium comanense TaxID=2502215 RepID=UPI0010F98723|nr:glycosyltransferase [Mesorhizobium comanense]